MIQSLTEKLAIIIVASVFIVIGLIFMVTPFIAGFPLVLVGLYMFKKALWGKVMPSKHEKSPDRRASYDDHYPERVPEHK